MRRNSVLLMGGLILLMTVVPVFPQAAGNGKGLVALEKGIDQGNFADVERGLVNYVIENRQDARGYALLARLRFRQDRLNEARSLYQRALAIDPSLLLTKLELAIIDHKLGRTDEAREALNDLAPLLMSAESRFKLAQALILVGDLRSALDVAESLPPLLKNRAALPMRAELHLRLGEVDKVRSLVPVARVNIRTDPASAMKFAEVLAGSAFNADAIALLRGVVVVLPRSAEAWLLLAKAEIHGGELERARSNIAKADQLAPSSADVALMRAMLANSEGDPTRALASLEESLERSPGSLSIMQQVVIAAIRANRPSRAVEIAKKLLGTDRNEPEFIYLYGAASLQAGRMLEAEEYLSRFVELRPRDSRACVALGISLLAQPAKLDLARRRLEQCVQIDPGNFEASYQLGISFKNSGNTQRAIALLESVVIAAPRYVPAIRDLGMLHLQVSNEERARELLEKAAALEPNDADTHFQLSRLYNLSGEAARAREHFEKFQKIKNSNNE